MKLQQGQVWQQGEQRLRIVHLERLSVEYMPLSNEVQVPAQRLPHFTVTKKEFCRLIKGAALLPADDASRIQPYAE